MKTVVPEAALTGPAGLGSSWATDFGLLSDGEPAQVLAIAGDRGFTTSGTSGRPMTWLRDAGQIVAEADVTAAVLGRNHDAVYSTVPPESLYGFAAVLVAATLKVPFGYDRWGCRRQPIVGTHPLVFSIPPSWRALPATVDGFLAGADDKTAVTLVHAGARLPRLAEETLQMQRSRGRRVAGVELFGASETGLVAAREFTLHSDAAWHLVPDVEIVPTAYPAAGVPGAGLLTVRSPRVGWRADSAKTHARAGGVTTATTGDVVIADGATVRIMGRAGRQVKPGGRWVDLDHLDEQLRPIIAGHDFATAAIEDALLGEHVELIVVGPEGGDTSALHCRLRSESDRLDIVPARIRTVASLDVSPMGKVRIKPTQAVHCTTAVTSTDGHSPGGTR